MTTPSHGHEAGEADFTCAICRRVIDMRWNRRGPDQTIPPICKYCEGEFSRGTARPSGGSYRDRREVTRGLALVEALRCAAAHKKWGTDYAAS